MTGPTAVASRPLTAVTVGWVLVAILLVPSLVFI
jgi:hypothetical protein